MAMCCAACAVALDAHVWVHQRLLQVTEKKYGNEWHTHPIGPEPSAQRCISTVTLHFISPVVSRLFQVALLHAAVLALLKIAAGRLEGQPFRRINTRCKRAVAEPKITADTTPHSHAACRSLLTCSGMNSEGARAKGRPACKPATVSRTRLLLSHTLRRSSWPSKLPTASPMTRTHSSSAVVGL
eukprot:1147912-Pelagomonas_calceolata.AAC.6